MSRRLLTAYLAAVVVATVPVAAIVVSPDCRVVDLDDARHARVLDHTWDAVDQGQPDRLTIKRSEAASNRRASLRGIPTRPGHDRDEYPPAVSDEGGAGANVRYVESSENRSAGSRLGREIRALPDGACFRLEPRP